LFPALCVRKLASAPIFPTHSRTRKFFDDPRDFWA
jgi:hypothetical protein